MTQAPLVIRDLAIIGSAGGEYGSGLPFDFDGTPQQALAQYQSVIADALLAVQRASGQDPT